MLKINVNSNFHNLIGYVEHINRLNGGSASALFVIQHDQVVAQYYNGKHSFQDSARNTGPDSQFNVASVRKSYLGLVAAWALYEGAIYSFDDPVLKYFQVNDDERRAIEGVTVRNLLTHTHGLTRENGEIVRKFIPGTDWYYNNVGIGLLHTLVSQTIGMPYTDFLYEKIFNPLGWQETSWPNSISETLVSLVNEQGSHTLIGPTKDGAGNLFVSARELAYWGYLHLKLGIVNGKSIVPESVIRTAIAIQSPNELRKGLLTNGCLWFIKNGESSQCLMGKDVPINSFEIVGLYGPLVLVVPELDLVVVRMSNQEKGNYTDDQRDHVAYLKEFSNLAVASATSAVY